jgi:3-phenylpropionate/cinnamic acid dioxygenase small subunit
MSETMLSPADDAEIRNLLARYCIYLDLDNVDDWIQLFTPDATYLVYGRTFAGSEGLRKMMSGAPGGLHLGGPPVIERVDDDHAHTIQNLLFVERSTGTMRRSIYDDELVRTAAGWRIASRRCRFIVDDGLSDRP